MTLIRPEGIWQSVDFRITRAGRIVDDAAPKQLVIVCPPLPTGPRILLGFTGLAEMPDGTPTLQWIRETVSGEQRFVMPLLEHLRDRLTRDVAESTLWQIPLVLCGGVFQSDGGRFYVEITNLERSSGRTRRDFRMKVVQEQEAALFYGGSGAHWITKSDLGSIGGQVRNRPAKWRDHLGLLAALNRRAAERERKRKPGDGTVSPWCHATYLVEGEDGAISQIFSKPGEPSIVPHIELVVAGLDLTGFSSDFLAQSRALRSTLPEKGKGAPERP